MKADQGRPWSAEVEQVAGDGEGKIPGLAVWVPKLARLHIVFSSKDDNHPWLAEWVQGWLGTSTRPTLQCMVISRLEARQASQSQKR